MFYSTTKCICFGIFYKFESSWVSRFQLGKSTSGSASELHKLSTFEGNGIGGETIRVCGAKGLGSKIETKRLGRNRPGWKRLVTEATHHRILPKRPTPNFGRSDQESERPRFFFFSLKNNFAFCILQAMATSVN